MPCRPHCLFSERTPDVPWRDARANARKTDRDAVMLKTSRRKLNTMDCAKDLFQIAAYIHATGTCEKAVKAPIGAGSLDFSTCELGNQVCSDRGGVLFAFAHAPIAKAGMWVRPRSREKQQMGKTRKRSRQKGCDKSNEHHFPTLTTMQITLLIRIMI